MNRSRKSFKKIAHERIDPVDLFYRLTGAIQSFHNQIDLSITKNEKTSNLLMFLSFYGQSKKLLMQINLIFCDWKIDWIVI